MGWFRGHRGHRPCCTAPRLLEGEQLAYAVLGVLCLHHAIHPGRKVHVQRELAKTGMTCDSNDLEHAVRWLRRRGVEIHGERGKVGYAIDDWPVPVIAWQSR